MTDKRKGWAQMVLKAKAKKQGQREGGEVFKSITEIERKCVYTTEIHLGMEIGNKVWRRVKVGRTNVGKERVRRERSPQKFGIGRIP